MVPYTGVCIHDIFKEPLGVLQALISTELLRTLATAVPSFTEEESRKVLGNLSQALRLYEMANPD